MPERLSLFRSASHAGPGGAQASEQQQRRHQQEQQQQQQEQRRDPAAATLGALPAAATPKCWAVVQTPLETLYDDEEEDSEESGYFNLTGTTAITPIYAETGRRSSTASASAKETAAATPALLVTERSGMAGRRLVEATGEKAAAIFQARGVPQHTRSEPHGMTCQLSLQRNVSQSTACTAQAAAETARPPAASVLHVNAAPAAGTRGGGSSSSSTSTSSLRPLLRLKPSSSVPNIQSHFKTRTLMRRPRSRNSGKEEGLQRETAFWGGNLFSDGDGDEQEEQQSSNSSSGKWPFGKELSDSLLKRCTVASGASVTSRSCTAPPVASLFPGMGEGHSNRVQSCGERAAAVSALVSSRLTSAGAATSVTTVSSVPTQQQQLLTPRSPPQESSVPGDRRGLQSLNLIGSSTPRQRDTSSVSSPQAAEANTSFSRQGGVWQCKGNLPASPAEHGTSKEISKGLPLLRRSLFHPFRKHVCVSEEPPGGSCPDFRTTPNTSGSSLSLAKSSTDVTDKRRKSGQQQFLQSAAGQVAAPVTRGSSGGLPPLPHQRCHSGSGGDLPAAATAAAGATFSPRVAYPLTGDALEAEPKPTVDARASAASVAVAALSSSSSFLDAARRTARNRKAASAAARASPQGAAKAEAVDAGARVPAAAAPPGEKIESTAPRTLSHLPLPCTSRVNAGKSPAAAGAAAAAAMPIAGIAAPAVAGAALVTSTLSTDLLSRAQTPEKQRSLAGAGESGGAVSVAAAEVMQPFVQRTAAAAERGVCGTAAPNAGENGLYAAVGSNQNSSSTSSGASGDDGSTGGVVSTVSTAAGGGRTGSNIKGTGGGGGVHRSGSFSSLSKKLSIRALKLRSGSGLSAPTAAAGASSVAATLSSTPTSNPHRVVSHIVVHNEEGGILAPHQQQRSDSHQQQQEQRPEIRQQSPPHAFESLRFSSIPAVLEEEGSQCSRSSSSSVGREEDA